MSRPAFGTALAEVKVRLRGQLGNQLFCYFAGAYLAKKIGARLKLDCNYFQGSDGRLALTDFYLPYAFRLTGATPRKNRFLGVNRTQSLLRLSGRVAPMSRGSLWVEPSDFGYLDFENADVSPDVRSIILNGFFQTHKYVDAFLSTGSRGDQGRLSLVNSPEWFEETRMMMSRPGTLALHVRLGDYLDSPRTLNYGRFISSLWNEMRLSERFQRVILFSDNFPMASSLIRDAVPLPLEAPPCPANAKPSEVMVTMSLARGIVTANSSFSWWSAYMSRATEIYAPWPWIGPGYQGGTWNKHDLFPTGWRLHEAVFAS